MSTVTTPAPQSAPAPSGMGLLLADLVGKRVTVYLWIRTGFLHFGGDLTSTEPGNFHVTVFAERGAPEGSSQAGLVFTPADVAEVGNFPDGRTRITLKAEARK